MRVGLTARLYYKTQQLGFSDGLGIYTKDLIENLDPALCTVKPVYFREPQESFSHLKLPDSWFLEPSVFLSGLFSFEHNIEKEIDLFHATDYRIPRLKKTPVIATLFDAIMFKHKEMTSNRFRRFKNHLLYKHAHYATHIITISHAMVPDIVEYWKIKPEKISVVYVGIHPRFFEQVPNEIKIKTLEKWGIRKKFCLFVGTLQPRKNIHGFIDAFYQLPKEIQSEYEIVIVGKPGWLMDELLPKLQKIEKEQKGRWLKAISFEDLQTLYQTASVFVYPSFSEGFGMPVIESFASGCPVVASNIPVLEEIAKDHAVLVDPNSSEAIAAGIQQVLSQSTFRQHLVEKAKLHAQTFTARACAENTMKIYQKIKKNRASILNI